MEDVSVSGVDLGIRNVAATVLRTWHKAGDIHESNVLHKSKDYHYKAGKHVIILGAVDWIYDLSEKLRIILLQRTNLFVYSRLHIFQKNEFNRKLNL